MVKLNVWDCCSKTSMHNALNQPGIASTWIMLLLSAHLTVPPSFLGMRPMHVWLTEWSGSFLHALAARSVMDQSYSCRITWIHSSLAWASSSTSCYVYQHSDVGLGFLLYSSSGLSFITNLVHQPMQSRFQLLNGSHLFYNSIPLNVIMH